MDIYAFRETPKDCITSLTPCKKRRSSCLMRDEIAISTSACNEFKREMAIMKLKCPFLTESQIQGRTMDKFGIPNIMGRPYKLRSGSVTYSTVNHILYLIKRSITEKKSYRKNSMVRRHTISGAYVPIEIITTKCNLHRNRNSKKNLEKKFSLYSEENDASDDNYSIESSGEYSRGRHSDILSISEFGYSYQSNGDEFLGPYKIRKTYERKSLDKFPTSSYFEQNKKRVSLTDDTNCKKLASDQNIQISKETASTVNLLDRDNKENDMEMDKQRENDDFKDNENQNDEVYNISGSNSFDLSNSSCNKTEKKSINTKDLSKEEPHDCNHEDITKKSTNSSRNPQINSVPRKGTYSEARDAFIKQAFDEIEETSDEEMDEIQIIYEKVEVKRAVEVCKEDSYNKIKYSQEKEIVSETSSVVENSQTMSSNINIKNKYIKQSISVCSGEYLWQDGSQSSIESSSIKSDSQTIHQYFQRFQRKKISLPFSHMDQSDNATSSQSITLADYKRRDYCRKTSECIILLNLEAQTDSEHNTSVDELSTKSGENSEENKSLVIHPNDLSSENSNDSESDTSYSASTEFDDSLKQEDTTDLNVAFSPHFATQNMSGDSSDEHLTSQETEIVELNRQRSEKSTTNEFDDEGYYLANLFDDDDNPNRQRTLRSTSVRENHSGDDEPTFVD